MKGTMNSWLRRMAESYVFGTTGWDIQEVAGQRLFEMVDSNHPPSMRTLILEDDGLTGDYRLKTPSEIDDLITHNRPTYDFEIPPDTAWTIRNQSKAVYVSGMDLISAQTFVLRTDPDEFEGQFVPEGVRVDISYGSLSGLKGTRAEDGVVVSYHPYDVTMETKKDGEVEQQKSWADGDWDHDIFEGKFITPNFDLSQFAVHRFKGDLYGSGRMHYQLRVIDREDAGSDKHVVRNVQPVTLYKDGITPMLDVFNLPTSVHVINESYEPGLEFGIGPKLNYTISDTKPPSRDTLFTRGEIAGNSLSTPPADRVIGVFRITPDKFTVPVEPNFVDIDSEIRARAQLRVVHPEYIEWEGGDLDDDSNWRSIGEYKSRNRAIQRLMFDLDDVTIETFADEDGVERMRGSMITQQQTGQRTGDTTPTDTKWLMDNYRFLVLTLGTRNSQDVELVKTEFLEWW